jgi:hypothetical protein
MVTVQRCQMRVARLSILDSYGVRWTHQTFARDLLQNFFDSAADFRAVSLDVREGEGVVEIRGPETFDLDLLAYIGATTKTSGRTVGGFGEGFKICALIGVRDFGLAVTAGSGAAEIAVFFDPVPLGRELCYRVTAREGAPIDGSYVRLEGCDAATLAAFRAAPAMFRHPDNPHLQEPLVVDFAEGVGVYQAADGAREGELYYRRQLRGKARFYASRGERPVTLAYDGILDELEGDRDRRDLPAEPLARGVGSKLSPGDLHRVLLALMPYWKYGNDVLSGLIGAAVARKLSFAWPPRWLARSTKGRDLNDFAERQGFELALAGFAGLGMATPDEHYTSLATRAATPMERAQFQVVAGLYEDLLGQAARTQEVEVFDIAGSAVLGQHLGDKLIVAAELLARGFNAVGGTVLHELAHETGGEEDIRFLRRLTNLLGAALREPEKVRAARRRYAAARPATAARAKASRGVDLQHPYRPEYNACPADPEGVSCTLIVPAGFPPSAQIVAAVRAAAAAAGLGVWMFPVAVSGPVGAVTWGAPGLPTMFIGGVDPEPPEGDRAALGYRLRTYGPDGAGLWPSPEKLAAAIERAKANRLLGSAGRDVHVNATDGCRERVREVLGVELPVVPPAKPPSRREARDQAVRAMVLQYLQGNGGFELKDGWVHGLQAASEVAIRAARGDRRGAEALFEAVVEGLDSAIEHAERLRDDDPDYDDADAFERDAMKAAQGAAISSYATETDDEAAKARAEETFRIARAATARVLDLDVAQEAKPVILMHAMKAAGLGWKWTPRKRSFEPEGFARGLEHAVTEALKLQRWIDEEGGFFSAYQLTTALEKLDLDPDDERIARRNARAVARQARGTHAARAAYERTLAESGSEVAAAARAIEEAARCLPEAGR